MHLAPVRFVLCLAVVIQSGLHAATYHVAQQMPGAADEAPGTLERPWKSIEKAAEAAGPGDLVIIHSGIYRERVVVKRSGHPQAPIAFQSAPGEPVVLTGADRLTGWRKADDARPIFTVPWPHKFISWNPTMTHPADEFHRIIGRCEQVIIDRSLLRQVLAREQLAPGTFFVDIPNKVLFVWDISSRPLNKLSVEAALRQEIFRVEGNHVQVRGLRFCYAANMAQHGAVVLAGRHNTLEDCVLEFMNSSGASFLGDDAVVRRCVFRDNGQVGFGASRAHRLLFTDCLVENNNTKLFDRGWEAGGNKLALCRDVVLERSRFLRNRGNGIWFDIGNTNCTVRQCLIAENEDAAIFYEISFRLVAHDNIIIGNGFASTPGAWGAQAGVSLSSSPGCILERNLVLGNREGFNFREQPRATPTIENRKSQPVWNHDQLIQHNLFVFNRDAQVWGWFDVKDNRHWPAANQTGAPQTNPSAKPGDIAAPYVTKTNEGHPQGLTLEKLHLEFKNNVYFAAPGQGWFKWGPTWARHKVYLSLDEFQSQLAIDQDSQVLNPGFADIHQLDFRLPAPALDRLEDTYPRGPVPGVHLGSK